ncbi:hypothetical protein [Candidatus Methylomicrobium oryzae]|uniref:hypothetical protein n=1 Tax=Candidatus Methylomicrobium oryzae TaxID=2802053 RepID=UPI0019218531|nr:hypothetical protein [Methylomicrobium sp. RS1]MBL1265721.1 hypothetical protein [Methylomicrobium sp. RS1]
MKQTRNRQVIIKCLTEPNEDCGGAPPYSASSIQYMLEHNHNWYGAPRPVSISQINRTLRDLHAAGLIVFEYRLDEPYGQQGLPQKVKYWQMADGRERNQLIAEVNAVCRIAEKAHGTFFLFKDRFFEEPMDELQKAAVIKDLKALMQKTHPDKMDGFEDQFKQLQAALVYVRSKVDLLKTPEKRLA